MARLSNPPPRILLGDNSVRSTPTALLNGRVGHTFGNGVSLSLDVLNFPHAKTDQIPYFYTSRLPGEAEGASPTGIPIRSSRWR